MHRDNLPLSERLKRVAGLALPAKCIADVGCDHGYVSIDLVRRGVAEHVIAMDLREGPLAQARENVRLYGVEDRINLRLSDGLAGLTVGEADGAVIAGMGGKLMAQIIDRSLATIQKMSFLVLQPQSELLFFRDYLESKDLAIDAEDMVIEDGKFYPMMRVHKAAPYRMTQAEKAYGPILLAERNAVLLKYLRKRQEMLQELLTKLDNSPLRKKEVEEEWEMLTETIRTFDK